MLVSKHVEKLVLTLTALAVAICLLVMITADSWGAALDSGFTMEYETTLFGGTEPLTIDIQMDQAQWEAMLENALAEEYVACNVVINGETFQQVGLRPKGNTSLSSVYNDPDSQRYSFKLEFDRYVEGQSCYGLDKLVLNNNYADATSMKEAVVYDMFAFLEADASLYTYAKISVNGEYWGVYLALEAVEDSFALRNYGTGYGEFYKPESMGGGGAGAMREVDSDKLAQMMGRQSGEDSGETAAGETAPTPPQDFTPPDQGAAAPTDPAVDGSDAARPPSDGETFDPANRPGRGEGGAPGGGMSGGGADLNYVDDELDSYATIWDGEVGSTSKADHQRVVEALKHISQGENLEQYQDVENLLKYMAVQTFVVNLDSLSGTMAHNYYLYEEEGRLNLIPWDYNLAFGGFQSGDASSTVNFPIDTPFTTGLEQRQFFAALLEDEDCLALYHGYLRRLAEEYVGGGRFAATVSVIRGQIDSLVATDPTAFYTDEEYDAAVAMLEQVVALRAESILGQLSGAIPATTDGQQQRPDALLDASGIDIAVMGQMSMGGGNRGGGQKPPDAPAQEASSQNQTDA